MTIVRAEPDRIVQYTHEELPWAFDFAAMLEEAELIASADAFLVDVKSGAELTTPIEDPPATEGAIVTQWVRTPRVGRYRFSAIATTTANRTWEIPVILEVPY